MKITNVEILYVDYHDKERDFWGEKWCPVYVKVNTDEGIYGLGEAGVAYGKGGYATWAMIKDLSELIIGMDPMMHEVVFDKLQNSIFWGLAPGAVIMSAISAIDIALWDIKGKALNTPLYQLLGGKFQNELRAYASQIQSGWKDDFINPVTPEEYAEAALKAVEEGYDAVKVDLWAKDEKGDFVPYIKKSIPYEITKIALERLEAIRKAVGDKVDIIIENHAHSDTTTGIEIGRLIEPYRILFYEEPNSPLNPKLAKTVKEKVNVPIAGGERIFTRWGYVPYFEDRSLDVIQPDIGNCGGISEVKKVCDMAHAYDISVQAHVCGTPLATSISLHLEASIPNFIIHEYHRNAQSPMNSRLCVYDPKPVNGKLTVPDLPGIGNDLTKYAYENAQVIKIGR